MSNCLLLVFKHRSYYKHPFSGLFHIYFTCCAKQKGRSFFKNNISNLDYEIFLFLYFLIAMFKCWEMVLMRWCKLYETSTPPLVLLKVSPKTARKTLLLLQQVSLSILYFPSLANRLKTKFNFINFNKYFCICHRALRFPKMNQRWIL